MDSDQRPISDSNTSSWPRRASRACASCRRDKIRCDGARPCSGCTKKGYSADQCIDGCDPCRRARARCENGKPCQRCRDMQLECTEEPPPPSNRQDSQGSSAKGGRPNPSERAKLACTNCRRDNKKCDDQRPCSRCVARSEECVHVGRGPKLVKLRCEGCRSEGKRCEDTRPCSNCVDGNRECITHPRKGRGHGTRVKAACVTCRRDKVRCDGVRPCAVCIRKGLECIDRACKTCAREGNPSECTHRKAMNAENSDDTGRHSDSQEGAPGPSRHPPLPGPPAPVQLPPLSQVQGIPPPHHMMYPPPPMHHHHHHGGNMPPIQASQNGAPLYYPSPIMGPGQPPPPGMLPTYISAEQRTPYYPPMNPNISHGPPSHMPPPHAPTEPAR